MIRMRSLLGALGVGLVLASLAPACAAPGVKGEVMMIVTTDMSLPKDIDKVRIEVARAAVCGYQGQEPVVADNSHERVAMYKNLRWKVLTTLTVFAWLAGLLVVGVVLVWVRRVQARRLSEVSGVARDTGFTPTPDRDDRPYDSRNRRQCVRVGHGHVRRAGGQDRGPVFHRQDYTQGRERTQP